MKQKLLLLGCAVFMYSALNAQSKILKQSPHAFKGASVNKAIPVPKSIDEGIYIPYNSNQAQRFTAPSTSATIDEFIIGSTSYDLQTNASIRNGLLNNGDGTLSAVWTNSNDVTVGGWPDRGTGYNYYDGTNWGPIPTTRLESTRTGWPSIAVTSSGHEAVVSHMGGAAPGPGVMYVDRPAKGNGAWTENAALMGNGATDVWSRMVAGGANGLSLHSVVNGSGTSGLPVNGQIGPVLYSRSADDGATWPVLRTVIPEIDANNYFGFGGDAYHMTTQDDKIAIGVSDFATDVAVIKSLDNGTTWTRTIIFEFPIPLFDDATMISDVDGDGVADTITAGAGDVHVLFDNNGLLHAWFTIVRVLCDDPATGLSYFPVTDGLYYWNENMGANNPVMIGYAPDLDGDGVVTLPDPTPLGCSDAFPFGLYRGGVTQMPTAGVDANNNLYCAYFTVNELSDTSTYLKAHKQVYIIKSLDGGNTWTTPENALNPIYVTQPIDAPYLEGVFANMAKQVDACIHLVYQRDFAPGHSLAAAGSCDQANNINTYSEIVYNCITPGDVPAPVGINEVANNISSFTVSNNFPNPAHGLTQFNIELKNISDITLKVTDIAGRVVYSEVKSDLVPGTHKVTLNVSGMAAGVYSYSVSDGSASIIKKMMVN